MANRNFIENKTVNPLTEIDSLLRNQKTFSLAVFLLNEIDASTLEPKDFIKYCYLKGKFLNILYKDSGSTNPEFLTEADKYFGELASTATLRNCKIGQDHLLFRIRTKLQIAELESDETEKLKMIHYIQALCKNALRVFPKCDAIISIQKSIQS